MKPRTTAKLQPKSSSPVPSGPTVHANQKPSVWKKNSVLLPLVILGILLLCIPMITLTVCTAMSRGPFCWSAPEDKIAHQFSNITDQWTQWSECNSKCGTGNMTRARPDRALAEAMEVQVRLCSNLTECIVAYFWAQWSDWSQCTKTCGRGGLQIRSRQCQTASFKIEESVNCGQPTAETRSCNEGVPCPAMPEWQPWSPWTSCSVTCGTTASRIRERSCHPNQRPDLCIKPDVAMETDKRDCGNPDCPPVNGGWSNWNPWSNCLVTCGWGYRVRNRLCNNPPPNKGGSDCGSSSTGFEKCLGGVCPVDGHWGSWSPCTHVKGSQCATTPRDECRAGLALYCRQCDNPIPEYGGSPCVTGLAADRRDCWNTGACDNRILQPPINFTIIGFLNTTDLLASWRRAPYGLPASSFFITWTVSGTDSVGDAEVPAVPQNQQQILGESYNHWIRGLTPNSVLDISMATRSTAGGALTVSEPLRVSFRVSRVDGGWGRWTSYSSCSPTADCNIPGTHTRSRRCDNPSPTNGGVSCPGGSVETSRCFHPC